MSGGKTSRVSRTRRAKLVAAALAVCAVACLGGTNALAATLPAGFQETVALSGLANPTVVRFASDGRIFVAEKSGLIKVFDNLTDSTPTTVADLRTNVHNFWDRGLLGLALAPNFPADPYVYVLYTYDAAIGGTAPRWGSVGATSDGCPTPPGATSDGCVVSGRLSRLQIAGNVMTGPEQVLIEDWCQQYPSHTVGSLAFGADGALYAGAGDGASFGFADYGQDGAPLNPCGDPPAGVGGTMTAPGAEGGALRSQDVRTTSDPTGLDGAILRLDPATGAGLPSNPLAFSSDANARRIVAYGFRNPFRITTRPGTNEVWSGDVGWNDWEEINLIQSQADGAADNYGWPCYEGTGRQAGYDGIDLTLCESLYAQPTGLFAPFFAYNHNEQVVGGETCATGSSSIAGLAFETGSNYPGTHDGALFFADYSRDCIWVMRANGDGRPDPTTRATFAAGASNPVDLQFGPDGALYYADFDGGTIRRIAFTSTDATPPTVSLTAPAGGATVSGTTVVTATAADNIAVAGVQFRLDGANLGNEDTTAPYQLDWDTAAAANGTATLTAVARDSSGNTTTSAPVAITVANQGSATRYVSDLTPTFQSNGYGPVEFDSANGGPAAGDGGAITLNGTVYAKGIGAHAPSDVRYAIPSDCSTFTAEVGVDDIVGSQGSIVFEIWIDGVQATNSALLTGASPITPLSADVAGKSELRLVVTEGGNGGAYDHADWAAARFLCASGQSNQPPTAVASASPLSGPAPLQVTFNGSASSDPDPGDTLTYAWDLDGDGQYDDSTNPNPTTTYTTPGTTTARLQVSDQHNHTTTSAPLTITAQNTPPAVTITSPAAGSAWKVGDPIAFSAQATDAQDGALPSAAFDWTVLIQHCPSNCHSHTYQTFTDTASASFPAPDHEYPSHLELRVTATDANGAIATTSLELHPKTVDLTFASSPAGLELVVGAGSGTTPFTRTVIVGSTNSITAPTPQTIAPNVYTFESWSQGGAATQLVEAPAAPATYTASYTTSTPAPPSVSLTSPSEGATVSGTTTVSATADDDTGVAGVQFKLDGSNLGSEDTTAPYQVDWDTTTAANGSHTLSATARDTSGAQTTSSPIGVTVANNQPPTAVASASPLSGPAPLQVTFNGSASSDPDPGDTLTYAWDLDGDGQYDDSTNPNPTTTYTTPGTTTARLQVSDQHNHTTTSAPLTITAQSSSACPTGQWKAEYFTNMTLAGSPVVTRCEVAIDNNWGTGSPATGVGVNGFSIRWSGRFTFPAGSTTFFVTGDDGIRLRVDGALVINQWIDQAATSYRSRQTLSGADHDVTVEYYENGGEAVARASWRSSLVAAYNFNESSGATVTDASGYANNGTIRGASRTSSGKFGRALSFNGTSNWVTVPDANVLDLTTQMTLEAWVYPTSLGSRTRSVVYKEAAATLAYGLHAHRPSAPGGRVRTSSVQLLQAPTPLPTSTWSHIGLTYDGATLRMFVNGVQVASRAHVGTMAPSTGVLRIGGTNVASEWFAGRIDDLRIYARALSSSEIQLDMAAGIP